MSLLREHADGKTRCSWVTDDALYVDYHDTEWGQDTRTQVALFEGICLEGFQAGLNWLTILKRREGFRDAFRGFHPAVVAAFSQADVDSLLADERIIRNGAKIRSAINNAQVVVEQDLDLVDLMWSFAPKISLSRAEGFSWKATSAESEALSRALKGLGFTFVGPTTMYALMQSSGMIKDHAPGCFVRG